MRLLLFLAFLPVLASACTAGYSLVYDGQCIDSKLRSTQHYGDAKNTCSAADGHLPMLYSKEDQDGMWSAYHGYIWIGLLCDGDKFVWEDGTVATYTNFNTPQICNSDKVDVRFYTYPSDGTWIAVSNGNADTDIPLCIENVRSWVCDTYFLLQQGKSDDICFLVDSKNTLVSQAESNCAGQQAHISPIHDQTLNDFVKRTAIANGLTDGVHIGLRLINESYVWSDGSEVDYTNFAPGFPDTTFGECVAMGINLFSGKWMNVDCATPLPYICIKPANSFDESVPPAGCSEDAEFYPGDEIYSPTWGSATGPGVCDYALMDLDKTKKVTVEIVFFESNSCCDTLKIYDGLFGGNVLKTLTGYYGYTSILVTGSTNAIRMEWNATSGAHVRGWHAKVGSVAA